MFTVWGKWSETEMLKQKKKRKKDGLMQAYNVLIIKIKLLDTITASTHLGQ